MSFSEFVFVRHFVALRSMFSSFGASPAVSGDANPHTLLVLILTVLDRRDLLHFENWSLSGLQIATLGTHKNSSFRNRILAAISQKQASSHHGEDFSQLLDNSLSDLLTLRRAAHISEDADARNHCTTALMRRLKAVQKDLTHFLSMLLCFSENEDISDRLKQNFMDRLPRNAHAAQLFPSRTITSLVSCGTVQLIHGKSLIHEEELFRSLLHYCFEQSECIHRDMDYTTFIAKQSRDPAESLFLHAAHHQGVQLSSRKIVLALVYGGFPLSSFMPTSENPTPLSERQGKALQKLILAWRSISCRF